MHLNTDSLNFFRLRMEWLSLRNSKTRCPGEKCIRRAFWKSHRSQISYGQEGWGVLCPTACSAVRPWLRWAEGLNHSVWLWNNAMTLLHTQIKNALLTQPQWSETVSLPLALHLQAGPAPTVPSGLLCFVNYDRNALCFILGGTVQAMAAFGKLDSWPTWQWIPAFFFSPF